MNRRFAARLTTALALAVCLSAQEAPVQIANVSLRLGMSKESVLQSFVSADILPQPQKLSGQDVYTIATYGPNNSVAIAGFVSFRSGVLQGIAVLGPTSDERAATLVKSAFTTVLAGTKTGLVDIHASRNEDANNPEYQITIVFKDREVVIATGFSNGKEASNVITYYPRRFGPDTQ